MTNDSQNRISDLRDHVANVLQQDQGRDLQATLEYVQQQLDEILGGSAEDGSEPELDAPQSTTKHTCNGGRGPVFGRRTAGCPRCKELDDGAEPVRWASSRAEEDHERTEALRAHFASEKHRSGGCGIVCTYGDW